MNRGIVGRLRHLGRRFFTSLWPRGPAALDEAWTRSRLQPGEVELWARMSGPDRRHAVAVARRVEKALGAATTRPVMAAALLHDVGKVEAGLGTMGRVAATVLGRSEGTGRMATYLRHDRIGAGLLEGAGSDPLTVAWARQHHLAPSGWTVEPSIAHALKAADDD